MYLQGDCDGNGKVKVRAVIVENKKTGRLVIKELPYGVTTESLTKSIEDAVRKKKVPVRTINDFTAESVEIELVLSPGTDKAKAVEALNAFTSCETSISTRLIVIKKGKPVVMSVDEVIRANTEQVLDILKRELELKKKNFLDELHNKTLVQIFIENRIYKKIEKCKTAEGVRRAVKTGLEPFADQLRRPVTNDDIDMLLSVRIRRISLFDINKNKKDIDDILTGISDVDKCLANLKQYTIDYLKGLIKAYGADYPRRSTLTAFKTVEELPQFFRRQP